MPKMTLTDEEAALIRERRIREAPIVAFNEGLDAAVMSFVTVVLPRLPQFNDDVDTLTNDFYSAIEASKRTMS